MSSSEEDSYSMIFTSLKHPIRRKILRILSSEATSFSDLQKQFNIESSHLTYHIDGLGNLLYKTAEGKYALSSFGEGAASMMKNVEEPSRTSMQITTKSISGRSPLKLLSLILACGLVALLVVNGIVLLRYNDLASTNKELNNAFSGLTNQYSQLNQSYDELNRTYTELNQTYFSSVPHTLAFETIAYSPWYPHDGVLTCYVILNESSLRELWDKMFVVPAWTLNSIGFNVSYPSMPSINFSESTVIAVLGGRDSDISYTVRIIEVSDAGEYTIVKVEKSYLENSTLQVIAGSSHVIKTQKINKPILFYTSVPPIIEIPITEPSQPLPEGYPRKMPDTSVTPDADGNRVHDVLDEIILEATQDNVSSKYVGLYHKTIDGVITENDIANMERFGGIDISLIGDGDILYGKLPYNNIYDYVASSDRILTIEPELASISYSSADRVLTHPEADLDRNGLDDDLDAAILDAVASDRGDQYVEVFSQFSIAPTDDDVAVFQKYGGILTSELFTRGPRFLGFCGKIQYNQIADYVAANLRIGFVEALPTKIELCMAYNTTQAGARAETMPTDCDYEHVAMLFNAKGYVMIGVVDSWIMRVEIPHVVCTKNSTYGLSYDPEYNLVHDHGGGGLWGTQVINMRDVAQAIRNYQKTQTTWPPIIPLLTEIPIAEPSGARIGHLEDFDAGSGLNMAHGTVQIDATVLCPRVSSITSGEI